MSVRFVNKSSTKRNIEQATLQDPIASYKNGWKSSHKVILIAYLSLLTLGVSLFIFTRLLIGKTDFFKLNYEYITQFMVPLYYLYLISIIVISLKGRNFINYISQQKPDQHHIVEDGDRYRVAYRSQNYDSLSADEQKKTSRPTLKSRRTVIKKVIASEGSDLKFILFAFVPVCFLFYLSVFVWSISDSSIFIFDVVDESNFRQLAKENLLFVADIFTKGIFADFMEHYDVTFSSWVINHESKMFSVFVLTFRTSISILFLSTIYRALNLNLRLRTFAGKKMYIASVISNLTPTERKLGISQ